MCLKALGKIFQWDINFYYEERTWSYWLLCRPSLYLHFPQDCVTWQRASQHEISRDFLDSSHFLSTSSASENAVDLISHIHPESLTSHARLCGPPSGPCHHHPESLTSVCLYGPQTYPCHRHPEPLTLLSLWPSLWSTPPPSLPCRLALLVAPPSNPFSTQQRKSSV